MLLYDARSQRGRSHVDTPAHGVVRKANGAPEPVAHVCHGGNVHVLVDGGVLTRALQQHDAVVAYRAAGVNGVGDFVRGAHPAGNDHGLAL